LRVDQDKVYALKKEKGGNVKPYAQYHSSFDNLELIDFKCVEETVEYMKDLVSVIETDFIPQRKFKGPAFLSKYDLWIDWRVNRSMNEAMMLLMYYLEGDMSAFQIAEKLNLEFEFVAEYLNKFYEKGLIEKKRINIKHDRCSRGNL